MYPHLMRNRVYPRSRSPHYDYNDFYDPQSSEKSLLVIFLETFSPVNNPKGRRNVVRKVVYLLFLAMVAIWYFPSHPSASRLVPTAPPRITSYVRSIQLTRRADTWTTIMTEEEKQKYYCATWDPTESEENDNPDCMRAKQYRQVMKVYDRQVLGEHPHWDFTNQWNLDTLRNVSRCFLPEHHQNFMSCPEKPLIVNGWWYAAEVAYGATSGETIWQNSIINELKDMGYQTALMGPRENWVTAYSMMPDVVAFLWNSDYDTVACQGDPRCVLPEHYKPAGEDLSIGVPEDELGKIPIDKLRVVDYWGSRPNSISGHYEHLWHFGDGEWSYSSLGQEWTVTPWPLPGHSYLPYTMEDDIPEVVPWQDRDHAALILAKRSDYFSSPNVDRKAWSSLAAEKNFDLLSVASIQEDHPLPDGISTLGKMGRDQYADFLGGMKALIGVGMPHISPSVYQALAQGVPVVLPQLHDIEDVNGWELFSNWHQHGPAAMIGPPYVYTYDPTDHRSLNRTVQAAINTPIEKFIPYDMTKKGVKEHLEAYLNKDWDGMFQEVLDANGGQVPKMRAKILERCLELDRFQLLPAGFKQYQLPSRPSITSDETALRDLK